MAKTWFVGWGRRSPFMGALQIEPLCAEKLHNSTIAGAAVLPLANSQRYLVVDTFQNQRQCTMLPLRPGNGTTDTDRGINMIRLKRIYNF